MNKTVKIILFAIVGLFGLALVGIVVSAVLVSVNPKAQIEKAKNQQKQESQTEQGSQMQAKETIEIKNFAFTTKEITIKAGDSVTWINEDLTGHSATADDGSWDTNIIANGESASITFDKPGTYPYHCKPHPQMKGTIIVK